ncbi:MAG TPA: flagellar FlbD family protein [Candidatus Polarisedimenticolia bacterium]|nr:flagellar FlbD family protein [Candidatus Polarisedimenticolia bacterium]
MIRLTLLSGKEIAINCDRVERAEAMPDTTLRLVSGESIVVLESLDELIRRFAEHRKAIAAAGICALQQRNEP